MKMPPERIHSSPIILNFEETTMEVVNTRLGLKVPALVTPDLLRPWEDRV